MKRLIKSTAPNGHFRIGRKWPRSGVLVSVTEEELKILSADKRIVISKTTKEDKKE